MTRACLPSPFGIRRRPFIALSCALLLAISACATPRAEITPEGRLDILNGATRLAEQGLSPEWHIEGPSLADLTRTDNPPLSFLDGGNGDAIIAITHSRNGFILARRTYAMALATPYLSWRWQLNGAFGREHPLSVVVGFLGGDPAAGKSMMSLPFGIDERGFPSYDRIMILSWGGMTGTPGMVKTDGRGAKVTLRTGQPGREEWVDEAVDLSMIYEKAWPEDVMAKARIAFIGVASAGDLSGASGKISHIVLSR